VLWPAARSGLAGSAAGPLSSDEKLAFATLATTVQFGKNAIIYRDSERAEFLYLLLEGAAKSFTTLPDGSNRGVTFHFPGDLFGWPEDNRYAGAAQALKSATALKIPLEALEARLRSDPGLALVLVRKLRYHVVQQYRQLVLLGRNDAIGRVATFIALLERREQEEKGIRPLRLHLPMSRSDIADCVGLSLEAVSRAFTALEGRGVLSFRSKRHFRVADRAAFQALVGHIPATVKPKRAVKEEVQA